MRGSIKLVNKAKGFGFIQAEDSKSYFFHSSGLKSETPNSKYNLFMTLDKKMAVQFTPTTTDKGLRAEDVELV